MDSEDELALSTALRMIQLTFVLVAYIKIYKLKGGCVYL